MIELTGSILILIGAVFLFSAGLGMFRMPDTFTRIQAGTKASTLGNMLVLIGLAVLHPDWSLKLVIVIYFVLMTNPISSHAIARAAYAAGMARGAKNSAAQVQQIRPGDAST